MISGKTASQSRVRSESQGNEKIRRLIVNVVFIIYWLLIFEGALRKWFFPGLHKIIYFIRDPFVLYVYYLVIRYKMWPKLTAPYVVGMAIAFTFLILVLLQSMVLNLNPLVSAVGWRGYFWYLPLAFIIGAHFRGKDLARLCKQTLIVAIPIALLTWQQFRSGPFSFLNKTYDDEATPLLLTMDVVRASGTFTIAAGQVMFIGSIAAMVLALWLLPSRERPLNKPLMWAATLAVLVNLYVSGSRSAFFETAFCLLAALLSGLVMTNRRQQLRCLILPGLISLIGAVLYVTVFSTAFELMAARQAMASANEGSTLFRALTIVTSLFEALPRSTFMGYGIGMGSNAGIFLALGARHFKLSENELPRIIEESGILGILYVGYRFWLVLWLAVCAIQATRRANNALPLLLFSFGGVVLGVGQITLQGTINGYGWLFAGFCMAANNLGLAKPRATLPQARARPA